MDFYTQEIKRPRSKVKRPLSTLSMQSESDLQAQPPIFHSFMTTTNIPKSPKEIKHMDTTITNDHILNTGVVSTTVVNALRIGNTSSTRKDKVVSGVGVSFKGQIKPLRSVTLKYSKPDITRIMLVYDKTPNQAAPAISTILASVGGTLNALSFRKLEHSPRYQVLWERTFAFGLNSHPALRGAGGTSTDEMVNLKNAFVGFKGNVKFKKPLVTYFDSDSGVGFDDIVTGAIFWVYIGFANDDVTADTYVISISSRYKYTDD